MVNENICYKVILRVWSFPVSGGVHIFTAVLDYDFYYRTEINSLHFIAPFGLFSVYHKYSQITTKRFSKNVFVNLLKSCRL